MTDHRLRQPLNAPWKGLSILFAFFLLLVPWTDALAQNREYAAMEGVTSTRTVFDFRIADANVARDHLDLIHSMLDSPSMTKDGAKPEIVIVLIGPSVNLVSTDTAVPSAGSRNAIARKVSAMHADGVRFEICMAAADAHEVSPDSILPEVVQVGNGWISVLGYQHQGYAMVADF